MGPCLGGRSSSESRMRQIRTSGSLSGRGRRKHGAGSPCTSEELVCRVFNMLRGQYTCEQSVPTKCFLLLFFYSRQHGAHIRTIHIFWNSKGLPQNKVVKVTFFEERWNSSILHENGRALCLAWPF